MTNGWRQRAPSVLTAIGLILAILPFVLLARHAHPSTDDFCAANIVREMGFMGAARHWYTHWTGRFVSIVMMNLSPLLNGSRIAYQVLSPALLAGLFAAIYWLVREVLADAIAASRSSLYALMGLAIFVYGMPSPAEGLYWHTGAVIFTFGCIVAIVSVAAGLRAQRVGAAGWCWAVAAGVAAFVAGGSNEIVLLLLGLVLLALAWTARRAASPRWNRWLVPLALVSIAFAVDVLAPGNARRAEATGGLSAPLGPLVGSAILSGAAVIDWLSSAPVLVGLGALVLAGVAAASRLPVSSAWHRTTWRVPAAVGAIGIWGALFFTHWTSGFTLRPGAPGRVSNVVYLFFLIAAALLAFTLGLQKLARFRSSVPALFNGSAWLMLMITALLFGRGNVRDAYVDLVTTRASVYDTELNQRYTLLRAADKRGEAVVPPLTRIPTTIFFRDITSDPADWRNVCYATFWAVPRVRVSQSDK